MARFSPDDAVVAIIREAMAAASSASDPYQRVGAAAWPIRAMVEREPHDTVGQALGPLLAESQRIDHPIRRMDALYLLWQAAFPLVDAGPRALVREGLVAAYHAANGWRAGFILRNVALMFANDDCGGAEKLADLMAEGKYKRQALRRIAAGETHPPREFFWP